MLARDQPLDAGMADAGHVLAEPVEQWTQPLARAVHRRDVTNGLGFELANNKRRGRRQGLGLCCCRCLH